VPAESPFAFYGVEPSFRLLGVWRPQVRGGGVIFTLGVILVLLKQRSGRELIYARDLVGAYIAGRLLGVPTVFEAHGLPHGRMSRWLMRDLLGREAVAGVVVISQALKDLLGPLIGPHADAKTIVARDAADPIPEVPREPASSEAPQVGYVGHLYPGRGVELIQGLARRLPEFRFHLIGGNERDIRALRAHTTLPNLELHGFVAPSDLPRLYRRLDILLMPYQRKVGVQSGRSDTARWMSPMKMFEYMAAGRPIVASDLPALREVLRHEENALLAPPDDPEAWIAALRRLAEQAVRNNGPYSDNTSAAALRWLG